ncbi:MAG: hypothetical protein LBQ59_03600 [Candidatus Peribacteria bacterium]|nr:hypothetical protein [Candidatus Peribacteria bacterium]
MCWSKSHSSFLSSSHNFSIMIFASFNCKFLFNHIDNAISNKTASCAIMFLVEATQTSIHA